MATQTPGDVKLCCGQPPRLMSGEGFGYALMCTECGRGLFGAFVSDTYQGASHLWNTLLETTGAPMNNGRITKIAMRTLRDMTDAHDVLRNIAFVLGVGGYNATDVDAEVFEKKILDGINMLVKPLTDRIESLGLENSKLKQELGKKIIYGDN